MKRAFVALLALGTTAFASPCRLVSDSTSTLEIEGDTTVGRYHSKTSRVFVDAEVAPVGGSCRPEILIDDMHFVRFRMGIPTRSLKSGTLGLDSDMYEALKADRFNEIRYDLSTFHRRGIPAGTAPTIDSNGELEVAGETRLTSLSFEVASGSEALYLRGAGALKMSDFDVSPPSALFGLIRAANQVSISFSIVLRQLSGEPGRDDP